ncbi:hypothetical protein LAZ67_X003871 [Cordylochernes scorpioides]|uniref:Uncharacterized protein n=1 Tax=Cordylochernes scorpioides TaxID=51811 RepID=A0ABY6LX36_9ARAC|nr:hypothetical protein LAZ67_X003871 [Cordylochernes scorpioides]
MHHFSTVSHNYHIWVGDKTTTPGLANSEYKPGDKDFGTPISTVSMPRRKIRAHYEHMSEFETGRAIGLKEAG